jgi:hypothetical protein
MGPRDDAEISRHPSGQLPLGKTTRAISSLDEAWRHTLDRCVGDSPVNEALLPLMCDCFFGGAMHAVLLLQKGHGDRLTSDIARYITQDPQLPPKPQQDGEAIEISRSIDLHRQ